MSKNPFQILDFLGFFFPGATVLIVLYYYSPFLQTLIPISANTSAIIYIVCIILAYIIGHILSLLSSITVEKYSIWKYGYPSDYLLNDYEPWLYFRRDKHMDSNHLSKSSAGFYCKTKIVFRLLVWVFLLPISMVNTIVGLVFGVDYYFTRKLSGQQITIIKGKCLLLFKSIGIKDHPESLFAGDFHRIIHNYYYEKTGKHSNRMDNCVAIYDFLRAMCLVSCVCFHLVLFSFLWINDGCFSLKYINNYYLLILSAFTSYVFFMGFIKYYRKFTVENLMCLLCDKDFDFPKDKEVELIIGMGRNDKEKNFTIK